MLIYQNAHQSAQLLQVWYRDMLHGLASLIKIWLETDENLLNHIVDDVI